MAKIGLIKILFVCLLTIVVFFCVILPLKSEEISSTLFGFCVIGVAPITQYTHVRDKNSNTQGTSPNVVKVISIP